MRKFEKLRQSGRNVQESIGAGFDPAAGPVQTAAANPQYAGVTKRKSAAEIPLERIRRDPNQPREEFDDESLARLAASLKSRGQLQPIRVRWDAGEGTYVVIAGERRWRAAQLAGMATIAADIHEGPLEADELVEIQLVENVLRDDLKPIEQAKAYRRIMDRRGWSTTQLAAELSLSQSLVAQSLQLLKLPAVVQEQVDAGVVSASAAYEVSKLPDAETQLAVVGQVVSQGLRTKDVRQVVKQHTRSPRQRKREKLTFEVHGFTITVEGPVHDEELLWLVWNRVGASRGKLDAA